MLLTRDNLKLGNDHEAAVYIDADAPVKVNGIPTYGTIWMNKSDGGWRITSTFLRRTDRDYGFAEATASARYKLISEALILANDTTGADLRAAERTDLLRRAATADADADSLFAKAAERRNEAMNLRLRAEGL